MKPPAPSPRDRAVEGWSSPLARGVGIALAALSLSGLWTYLAPFSVFSQLLVLTHTAGGLLIVVPTVVYGVRHWRNWWRQKATAAMILGYALAALVVASLVTGVVVTWQGLLGTRIAETWDLVHLIAGLGLPALLAAHLIAAWSRRRLAALRDVELAGAMRSAGRRGAIALALAFAACLATALLWPRAELRFDPPPDYSLPTYAQEFDEYRGNPFAPTYARTVDDRLVAPELLAGSATCGTAGCHSEILDEWEPSAHRFAAMNPPFQAVQTRFAIDREPAETRYCAGCHDPISLFAGAKDPSNPGLGSLGVDEGISCVACHSISRVDERGNADYELTPPRKYLGETSEGLAKGVSDFLIRAYPRQHLADYDRNLLRSPEFCGACHKQFIPEALNRFGLVEGQNQYDEWKNGHWHTDDPATDLSCRDCHMRLVPESSDPGHGEEGDHRRSGDDRAHRHHGFIATNNFMPELLELPHWQEQVDLTNAWIRGEDVPAEIADVFPEGPVAGLDLLGPSRVASGDELVVRALVTNRKAGHNFITGPLDFIRSWVHLRIRDRSGRLLAEWGLVDPETREILDRVGEVHRTGQARDEGTLVFEAIPIDGEGRELRQHELWNKAGGKGKRVVFPRYSDSHSFRLLVPEDVDGPLLLEADLKYRRYRQEFLDLVLPGLEERAGVIQPIVSQASARLEIPVAESGASPSPQERIGG